MQLTKEQNVHARGCGGARRKWWHRAYSMLESCIANLLNGQSIDLTLLVLLARMSNLRFVPKIAISIETNGCRYSMSGTRLFCLCHGPSLRKLNEYQGFIQSLEIHLEFRFAYADFNIGQQFDFFILIEQ